MSSILINKAPFKLREGATDTIDTVSLTEDQLCDMHPAHGSTSCQMQPRMIALQCYHGQTRMRTHQ